MLYKRFDAFACSTSSSPLPCAPPNSYLNANGSAANNAVSPVPLPVSDVVSNGGGGGKDFERGCFSGSKGRCRRPPSFTSQLMMAPAITVKKYIKRCINGGRVVELAVSPDGQRVAYKADQQVFGKFELSLVALTVERQKMYRGNQHNTLK